MSSLLRNDDLNVLGPDMRPSYRWLLIGSSGSVRLSTILSEHVELLCKGKEKDHVSTKWSTATVMVIVIPAVLREIEPLKWISKFCPRKQNDGKFVIFVQSEMNWFSYLQDGGI